jgi:hypothetical protein
LRLDRTVTAVADVSWFDVSADRRTLYLTNEIAAGTISTVDLDDPARPKLLNKKWEPSPYTQAGSPSLPGTRRKAGSRPVKSFPWCLPAPPGTTSQVKWRVNSVRFF